MELKKYFLLVLIFIVVNLSGFDLTKNFTDLKSASSQYYDSNKKIILISAGIFGSSLLLDRPIRNLAVRNRYRFLIDVTDFTNNLGDYQIVLPGLALVGTYGLIRNDDKIYQTVKNSFESCFIAGSLNLATKFIIGRERPFGTENQFVFHPFSLKNKFNSFFSGHTTIAWSIFTPFALAYQNPYFYIFPAVVNISRIYKNQHWLSDTIASTIIGFSSGYIIYHLNSDKKFKLNFTLNSVNLSYNF